VDVTTPDVFISYAREDRASAKRLAEALTATRGWSVWWDVRLRTGEPFPREIELAISEARCVVVLWSSHSIDSSWVIAEVSEGWKRGVLTPVLIDACKPPMPFRQLQNADLTGWAGSERAPTFLALVEDIQRVMARGSAVDPRELQEREARQRRVRRSRTLKRVGLGASIVAGVCSVALLAWLSLHKAEEKRFGEDLIAKAENIVNRLQLEYDYRGDNKHWWYVLTEESPETVPSLELSALLTIEGRRMGANADHATRTLQSIWSVLPWSDRARDMDGNSVAGVLEFNSDGHLLAAGGGCGPMLVWDLRSDKIIGRIDHGNRGQACRTPVEGVPSWGGLAFSPSSDILATGGPDATARLWTPDGRELRRLHHQHPVTDVRFGRNGDLLVTTDQGGSVRVWDVGTGREVKRMQHDDWAYGAVLSPSGKYLGTGSRDLSTRIWDVASGKELYRVMHNRYSGGTIVGVEFCPDEDCFVTYGGADVAFRKIETGELVWSLEISSAKGVIFAGNRRVIVGSGGNEPVSAWDTATHESVFDSGATYSDILQSIVGSRNGTVFATGGWDHTARAWDAETGRELKRLPYSKQYVSVGLSADGKLLASSGFDPIARKQVVEVTELRPDNLVESTCARVGRNLTAAEWREYFYDAPYHRTCPRLRDKREK
jgi:WD40 repeat protein